MIGDGDLESLPVPENNDPFELDIRVKDFPPYSIVLYGMPVDQEVASFLWVYDPKTLTTDMVHLEWDSGQKMWEEKRRETIPTQTRAGYDDGLGEMDTVFSFAQTGDEINDFLHKRVGLPEAIVAKRFPKTNAYLRSLIESIRELHLTLKYSGNDKDRVNSFEMHEYRNKVTNILMAGETLFAEDSSFSANGVLLANRVIQKSEGVQTVSFI